MKNKEVFTIGFVHCLFTKSKKDNVCRYIQDCLPDEIKLRVQMLSPSDYINKKSFEDVDEEGEPLYWARAYTRRLFLEMQADCSVDLILVSDPVFEDNFKEYVVDCSLVKKIGYEWNMIIQLRDRLSEVFGDKFDRLKFARNWDKFQNKNGFLL